MTESNFLSEVLWNLSNAAASFNQSIVVIRNHELLPAKNAGKDIDIIVRASHLSLWVDALRETAAKLDLQFVDICDLGYCRKTRLNSGDGAFALEIDFNYRLVWRGVEFCSESEFFSRVTPFRPPIWTVDEPLSIFLTFCHGFLYGGCLKAEYVSAFAESLSGAGCREAFAELAMPIFGDRDTEALLCQLASGELTWNSRSIDRCRWRVLTRSLRRNFVGTSYRLLTGVLADSPLRGRAIGDFRA